MLKKILAFLLLSTQVFALGTITGGGNTQKNGSSTFATRDAGTPIFGVRNDGGSLLIQTDLSYGPIALDAAGRVQVGLSTFPLAAGAATLAEQVIQQTQLEVNGASALVGNTSLVSILDTLQTGVSVIQTGKLAVDHFRYDYTGTSVVTTGYTQLVAATAGAATETEIFDSSGQTLVFAFGGVGAEIDQIFVLPGGNGRIPLAIPAATRISVKAVSAPASAGEISVDLYK